LQSSANKKQIKFLNDSSLKITKHLNEIISILGNSSFPVTAEEVYMIMQKKKIFISLSTIYRIFETLSEKEIVIKSNFINDRKARFEINRNEHKHHVLCLKCHTMIDIFDCPFDGIDNKLRNDLGFKVTSHNLEIYGLCKNCLNEIPS